MSSVPPGRHNRPFRKCALPQCSGLRFNLVHKFPRRKERLQQWLDAIGSQRLSTISPAHLNLLWICCRHFRVEDYVNPQSKTLNVAAVPSLNLQNLDDLDKCRQGDVEKATVLTAEEIIWIQESKSKGQLELLKRRANEASPTNNSNGNRQNVLSPPATLTLLPASNFTTVSAIKPIAPAAPVLEGDLSRLPCCHTAASSHVPPAIGPPTATVSCADGEDTTDFTLYLDDGYIEINDFKLGRNYELNSLWLRSLCRCTKCFDTDHGIPRINIFELPRDVQPIMANVSEETTKLEIVCK